MNQKLKQESLTIKISKEKTLRDLKKKITSKLQLESDEIFTIRRQNVVQLMKDLDLPLKNLGINSGALLKIQPGSSASEGEVEL